MSSEALGSHDGSSAPIDGDLVGIALVDELVASEVGDDVWVQSRAVDEVITDGGEGVFFATIEDAEGDLRGTALVEVSSGGSSDVSNTST